jgi:hypothetical protein
VPAAVKAHSEKCPSCGKQHVPGFSFCQRCGSPLWLDADGESAARRRRTIEYEEAESTDLNGQLMALVEQGRTRDAIRLYHEALGCEMTEAEAAIRELAKNVEFAVAPRAASKLARPEPEPWLSRCVAAVKAAIGL